MSLYDTAGCIHVSLPVLPSAQSFHPSPEPPSSLYKSNLSFIKWRINNSILSSSCNIPFFHFGNLGASYVLIFHQIFVQLQISENIKSVLYWKNYLCTKPIYVYSHLQEIASLWNICHVWLAASAVSGLLPCSQPLRLSVPFPPWHFVAIFQNTNGRGNDEKTQGKQKKNQKNERQVVVETRNAKSIRAYLFLVL